MASFSSVVRSKWSIFVSGLIFGALIILGIRWASYQPADTTHYHANFAVYINGQQQTFSDPRYYQEVSMCTADTNVTPIGRAHMHDNINNVVHVEDHAVTWGQFFENLGWALGGNFIATPDHMYLAGNNDKLHILLNNQDYTDLTPVSGMVIKDQDKLLVSFGDVSAQTLQKEYNRIPSTAHQYDTEKDPKSCSGNSQTSPSERFKHLF